jgi:ABC-type transport system involved in cytochrome bd biosynthesis fused ATPase/permease subunit
MFNSSSPKVRKLVYGLLTNRWGLGCISAIACQQIIEASSTVWLVNMMANIASGKNFFVYLALYLLSIALFYVPNGIAFILKTTWKQQAQRSFVHAFVASNKNNIGEWSNKGLKEEKLSILTSEGPAAINALIDYVWDLGVYVFSVVFNILALSIIVEPLFAVAYGFSLVCVLIVMKLKRRAQRQLTQKALTARVDLCQSLFAAWDNVLLGNFYNFNIWQEKTEQRLDRCLQRNVALERFDQFLAIFVSLMTSIPSLMVAAYFMYIHRDDPVRLSAFVVILPLLKKVKWPKINVNQTIINGQTAASADHISLSAQQTLQSYNDLLGFTTQSGRVTIRGENGCGKSTALLLVKNALSKKAFFLPTHNQLSFHAETNKYSTGESLRNRLLEILEKVDAEVLLLDEWDANLDSENKERLNLLIDELAVTKCVIEVRHR